MKIRFLPLALVGALAAGWAQADTIDFTQLTSGDLGPGPVTVDGVTFVPDHNIYNYSDAVFPTTGGSICSLDPGAFDCQNDLTVKFNGKVKGLTLETAEHDAGDSLTISLFRGKKLLGSPVVISDGVINLRSFGRVTKLVVDDNSTGGGYALGNFQFTRLTATAKQDRDQKTRRAHKGKRAAATN